MISREQTASPSGIQTKDGLRVRPVSDAVGAEILDVDLAAVDGALFEKIHDAWMDNCVLLFRGQENMSDDALVAFSRRIGTLDQAPPNENGKRFVSGFPEICQKVRAASSILNVPVMLVSIKSAGPSIDRSTWDSAARCITTFGLCF